MKRKLEKYFKLREESEKLCEAKRKVDIERINLEGEFEKVIVKKELYGKLSELEKYEGCDIESIDIIEIKDGKIETERIWNDEIFEIRNGKLYYSSYDSGILSWDSESKGYKEHYFGRVEEKNIIGFFNLKLEDYNGKYDSYDKIEIIKSLGDFLI